MVKEPAKPYLVGVFVDVDTENLEVVTVYVSTKGSL